MKDTHKEHTQKGVSFRTISMEREAVYLLAKEVNGLALGHVRPLDRLRQLERGPDESVRRKSKETKTN